MYPAPYCARIFQGFCIMTQTVWHLEAALDWFSFAPLIWNRGPNSRLLAVRARTIIYYNSPNWLTPVLWKPTETPCYISRLRWKSFSVTAMERTPHSLLLPISFSKLWKMSVFCTCECLEEWCRCVELIFLKGVKHLPVLIICFLIQIWSLFLIFSLKMIN